MAMPRGSPSGADIELADQVRANGILVSPRQVQKIREEYGVIRSRRRFLGRHGSESFYDPEAAAVVARFQRLLRLLRSVPLATVFLFIDGYPLPEETLKGAIGKCTWVGDPPRGDPWKAAEAAATKARKDRSNAGVVFRQMVRANDADPEAAMSDVVALQYGETLQAQVEDLGHGFVPEIVRATGLGEAWANDPEAAAKVDQVFRIVLTPRKLTLLLKQSSVADLELARSRALEEMPFSPGDVIEEVAPRRRKAVALACVAALVARLALIEYRREEAPAPNDSR